MWHHVGKTKLYNSHDVPAVTSWRSAREFGIRIRLAVFIFSRIELCTLLNTRWDIVHVCIAVVSTHTSALSMTIKRLLLPCNIMLLRS